MARTESVFTLLDPSGQALLDEEYGKLLENLQSECVSMRIKNTNLSGDPDAGSVEVDRYYDLALKDEGTARSAMQGDKAKAKPLTININIDKENMPEFHQKDLAMKKSLKSWVSQVRANQARAVARYLDRVFWNTAKSQGRQFLPDSTISGIDKQFDAAIVLLENLSNDFIDGVTTDNMVAVFDNATYMELKEKIDEKQNPDTTTASGKISYFHDVECYHTHRLPSGTKFILMVKSYSVAQPAKVWYNDFFRPEYTNHVVMPLFLTCGCKAVAPESILWFDGTTDTTDAKSKN